MPLLVQFSCQSVDEMEPSRSERTGDLERDLERDGERELDGEMEPKRERSLERIS